MGSGAPNVIASNVPPGRVRIFVCGDVMTGRGVDQILAEPGSPRLYERWISSAEDYVRLAEHRNGPIPRAVEASYVWGDALDEWRRSTPDVRIVNLETSVTGGGRAAPKGINYRMSPANIGCLTAAGVDCCVLSNNHVIDWGRNGLLETLDTLHGHGFATAGAGRDLREARRPAVLELARGGRVLVAGLCAVSSGVPQDWAAGPARPGVNLVELSASAARELGDELRAVRRPRDLVVASVHWGQNWGYEVSETEQAFAGALVDLAGVDLVHGHSSHHPKAMALHRGRLVLYGCGDFLDDYEGIGGHEAFRGDLVLMCFADLDARDGRMLALEMAPFRIRRFRLERAAADDVDWLADRLDREAARFGGRVSSVGSRLVFSAGERRG
jgi:poly-gamma-glutamate capsule biosynthesis protein CapA/YwtB (metallophosphatase superfamily)